MPTYEYACSECGHRFDVRQSFNDEPIRDCPKCGASVYRVVHPAGVIFKGSGWYVTDSRQSSPASHSEASSSKPTTDSSATPATTATSGAAKETAKPAATD